MARGIRYYDLNDYGDVPVQQIIPGLRYDEERLWQGTLQQYFDWSGTEKDALVITGHPNVHTNVVLPGKNFFAHGETGKRRRVFHEFLHVLYQAGDKDLARTFGLGTFESTKEARKAIQDYINRGCKK